MCRIKSQHIFMTIRKKYRALIITWFVLGIAFIVASTKIHGIFIIALLILFFLLGALSRSLKCPNCGKKVLHNNVKILGIEMKVWTSWIPAECQKCGLVIE